MAQCLDLADLITSHSGQRSTGLISLSNSKNDLCLSFWRTPGSFKDAKRNDKNTKTVEAPLTTYRKKLSGLIVGRMTKRFRMKTTRNRLMNRAYVLWFFFRGINGTFSIMHSQYDYYISMLWSSLCIPSLRSFGIIFIGVWSFWSFCSLSAPRSKRAFTFLVDPSLATLATAICKAVKPYTSFASRFGFMDRRYVRAISDLV